MARPKKSADTWQPKEPRDLQVTIEADLVRRLKSLACLNDETPSQTMNRVLKTALRVEEADTTKGRNGASLQND